MYVRAYVCMHVFFIFIFFKHAPLHMLFFHYTLVILISDLKYFHCHLDSFIFLFISLMYSINFDRFTTLTKHFPIYLSFVQYQLR